jgi:hypothetical protein
MKNVHERDGRYLTKDFYSASLLKAQGLPLVGLEKGGDRFYYFVFNDGDQKADQIIQGYWNRSLQVEAKDLIDAIQDLKTILYSK